VGSFDIELVQEGIEAGLLLQTVHARRARGFLLQSEVHAFMAAVLLWQSGLDAFDSDAGAEPPDRELGEIGRATSGPVMQLSIPLPDLVRGRRQRREKQRSESASRAATRRLSALILIELGAEASGSMADRGRFGHATPLSLKASPTCEREGAVARRLGPSKHRDHPRIGTNYAFSHIDLVSLTTQIEVCLNDRSSPTQCAILALHCFEVPRG
jgi:hypothetical protein